MRITSAVIAAGLLAALGSAASAETEGWYAGAEAGLNIVPKTRFDANAQTWHEEHENGYAILGQVGYGFGQIRLEGEVGWRANDLKSFQNSAGTLSHGGGLDAFSLMANGYYDFDTGTPWTPFLGIGVGGVNVEADSITARGVGVTNGSDWALAYQGIAGMSYAVNQQLSLKADYRYIRTDKANLSLEAGYGAGHGSTDYAAHSILVGFTYKFGQPAPAPVAAPPAPPPPAPMAAPAPAPKPVMAAPIPKNFMVFFDFDKDALTPEAKAIITQAANAANKQHSTVIALTGYTDLSGSSAYNQKLSVRRGDAVKKMLVQLGIPAGEITVIGKGKTDPLVPTKDGVKEPQNRRVQIILQ